MHISGCLLVPVFLHPDPIASLLSLLLNKFRLGFFFPILIKSVFFQVLGENFGQKTVGGCWYFFRSILCPVCCLHILAMTLLKITIFQGVVPWFTGAVLIFQSQADYALL